MTRRLPGRIAPLIVFVVAAAVFAQTASYDFTYDDVAIIRDRMLFHSIANWREILGASWWSNHTLYRPLTALSLAANWSAGGGAPPAFHLTNIFLHALAAVLVYLLARRLIGAGGALVAGLLFAVHPVHVEAVANVVGRAEVLATVFALTAVLCYGADGAFAAAGEAGSWRRLGTTLGTLVSVLLALASKETAFAVPGLLLLMDWIAAREAGRRLGDQIRLHWLLWFGALAVAVGWLDLRATVVQDLSGREVAPGLEGLGLAARTVAMLPAALHYVRLLFVPIHLSADYSPAYVQVVPRLTGPGIWGIAVLLATGAVTVVAWRRAPVVAFAIGWIAATVFIVANIVAPTGVILAERTLYLPSVGAVLILAWLWREAARHAPRLATVGVAALALLGAARTVVRNPVWSSNAVFFRQLVRDAPGSYRAAWTDAMLSSEAGDLRRSEERVRDALRIHPLNPLVWRDLARLLRREGRYAEAAECFWSSWRLDHTYKLDAQRAIQSWVLARMVDTAESRLAEAQAAAPESLELMIAASDVALARNKPLKAMTLRRQVAWYYPDNYRYWAITADAAFLAHQCPQLLRSMERVRALKPELKDLQRWEAQARELHCH